MTTELPTPALLCADVSLRRRFEAKVRINPDDPSGCHIWTPRTAGGAGQFGVYEWDRTAHDVAWLFSRGEWPESPVTQTCGDRLCVNPEHLADEDTPRCICAFGLGHGCRVHSPGAMERATRDWFADLMTTEGVRI